MKFPIIWLGAGLLAVLSTSCGNSGTGSPEDSTKNTLEVRPIRVDAEQVTLTGTQIECGVKEDLWEAPLQVGDRTTAKLTQKGRDLKFADDVAVVEPGYKSPYVQVRGEFPVQVLEVVSVKDGPSKNTKVAQIKGGIVIQHQCFNGALALQGVKNGRFNQDVPARFQFDVNGETWTFDKLVH